MEYLISFLEGVITFVSPCLLPMLPIYVTYFAAGGTARPKTVLKNSLGFVLGFTIVFVCMGALAGTIGSFFAQYRTVVNIVCGLVIIIFGLGFLGIVKLDFFKGPKSLMKNQRLSFFRAMLFGIVFSIGWTPCVGTFLGSALMMASQSGTTITGVGLLVSYSAGLGVPFVISALLIDALKQTFNWIKRHYGIINKICGWLLIALGLLMATGFLDDMLGVFA